MTRRQYEVILASIVVFFAGICGSAQTTRHSKRLPAAPRARSMAEMNYLGGDAAMPPLSDSVIPVDSKFRTALFKRGIALRLITQAQYAQNMLDAPVAPDNQVYAGQRAFEGGMLQPLLTADLRQLHLRHAQLYVGGVWNWVSWNPAGPKSFQLWDLYLYKSLVMTASR